MKMKSLAPSQAKDPDDVGFLGCAHEEENAMRQRCPSNISILPRVSEVGISSDCGVFLTTPFHDDRIGFDCVSQPYLMGNTHCGVIYISNLLSYLVILKLVTSYST